jgi:hypothetical protein
MRVRLLRRRLIWDRLRLRLRLPRRLVRVRLRLRLPRRRLLRRLRRRLVLRH